MSEKRARVAAALAGQAVDRPPISMWRHFYDRETTAEGLAKSMLGFQRQYDWDFMKVNPRAQYHAEDWGATFSYSDDPHAAPTVAHVPIASHEDWHKLEVLDPHRGTLAEHLQALRLIREGLAGDVPFVMTVFNPISIAGRLVESDDVLAQHLLEHPREVHAAMEVITQSYCAFVTECLNEGADGIFFATTSWASHDLLTDEQYQEFGRPYDVRVLDAARDASFNILHVCRSHNMLKSLADYPNVHALNWDDRDDTNASLQEARGMTSRTLMGGVSRHSLTRSQPADVAANEVRDAIAQAGGRGLIIGPGCAISPRCPEATLRAARQAAEG